MKVEATWRGPGRLELLISGVQPGEADGLLESLGVEETVTTMPNLNEVGWAMGFTGGTFFGPVWHWFHQGWSVCRRWRADRATGPFLPNDEGLTLCNVCEREAA